MKEYSDCLFAVLQTVEATGEDLKVGEVAVFVGRNYVPVNPSLQTIQESEVTKRLAAYAALVGAPTMIAGIYGVNSHNMPELSWDWGYPVSVATMAAIDSYLFARRSGCEDVFVHSPR